jgi:hypothetical protein
MLQDVHVVGVCPLQIARLVFERAGNFINAEAAESAEDAVGGVCICEDVLERKLRREVGIAIQLFSGCSLRAFRASALINQKAPVATDAAGCARCRRVSVADSKARL